MTASEPKVPDDSEDGDTRAGPDLAVPVRLEVEAKRSNHAFWRAIALAVALHASLLVPLVGFPGTSETLRRMGEAGGDPNAINVDVVEAAQLPSAGPPPADPPAPPPTPEPPPIVMEEPTPQPPRDEPPVKEAPVKEARANDEPVKEAIAKQPQAPVPKPPDTPSEKQQLPPADIRGTTAPDGPIADQPARPPDPPDKAAQTAALMKEMTEIFAPAPPRQPPPPREKQSPSQPSAAPSAPPNAAPSVLDIPMQFQGNSSSFARPVDATRSGENDEFGRNVIRALRQTMPSPWGIKSRVTIKFYLSETGQVAEMRLMQGSGIPLVDQSVVFAARNSTFPRPPPGSKVADRVFLVTYIYE